MALTVSPRIVTNGLSFYYDQNNIKSYRGPVVQNLASTIGFNNSTATGISVVGGYETVDVPQIGRTTVTTSNIQNNYNLFTPNSTACCPSPFFYGNGLTVTPSTLYTYAIVYKVISGYTNSNYMYRYEFTGNGGTLVTEAGVHNTTNRIHLGGDWYWAWATFTTRPETNWLGYHGAFYYRYSNTIDKMSIAKVLLCQGDFTQLHPKYWPNTNTTRSNTQTLFDLTGTNTITADSLTYASNSTFSFNGSNNFIRPNITHSYLSSSCLEVVFRKDAVTGRKYLFGYRHNDGFSWPTIGSMYFTDNTLKASVITSSQTYREVSSSLTINANQFYHVCFNKDTTNGLMEIFVNGVSRGSLSFDAATYAQWPSAGQFIGANILDIGKSTNNSAGQGWGADFFDGIIPVAKVYNRILTAAEVQQNFNAIRGRYGI